jgi:Asp/Glu/hydantoin racemase
MFDISPLLADAREDASAEVVGLLSSQQAALL